MKKALIIFEDSDSHNLTPLTLLRPSYFLRPGIRFLYEKYLDNFNEYKPFLFCRSEIADLTSQMTTIPVNRFVDDDFEEIIFINGRVKENPEFMLALKKAARNVVLVSGDRTVAFKILGKISKQDSDLLAAGELGGFLNRLRETAEELDVVVPMYQYLWEIVGDIKNEIRNDFDFFKEKNPGEGFLSEDFRNRSFQGVELINPKDIYISTDAQLLPGIVLDASRGPIFVGSRVRIEPHTYLVGPSYIGKESILVGGKITGCSIGPVCRVGGEVEETVIQGYTNKYHAGFIGHAYLGEWINLGAMTTNSDLKNNYGNISVSINGNMIDTGLLKVGSFIGDFTKTAIGTLLNTGINIGVSCNIIADGLVTDKEIPSFTWYSLRRRMAYNFARAITTIERTMARRNCELSDAARKRLKEISLLSWKGDMSEA